MTEQAFLCAFLIGQHGAAEALEVDEIRLPEAPDEYLWLHLQSDADDTAALLNSLGITDSISDGLCAPQTRAKALQMDDGVLVYLRGINNNPEADPEDMVSLRIWCGQRIIITARRKGRRLMSVQALQDDVTSGNPPSSPTELLLDLIVRLADRIQDTVDNIDDVLEQFEDNLTLSKQDRRHLADRRRQTAAIRRFLAPQRDALDALFRLPGFLDEDQAFFLREQTDRITRCVEDLDLARERAVMLQDEIRNRVADQQGMRMYVLSMVTAVFLPLSFITGVFGMNVGGLPGTSSPSAFTMLMAGMGVLAVLMLIAMLWKKWL